MCSSRYLLMALCALCVPALARGADISPAPPMFVQRAQDAVLTLTPLTTAAGAFVGARAELLNPSASDDLIVVLYKHEPHPFRITLFDQKGHDVSPLQKVHPDSAWFYKRSFASPSDLPYWYERIAPRTSRCWFIPLPNEVRVAFYDGEVKAENRPIPAGDYRVEVKVHLLYFLQAQGLEIPAPSPRLFLKPEILAVKYPQAQDLEIPVSLLMTAQLVDVLEMQFPPFAITVAPADLELDPLAVYTGLTSAPAGEADVSAPQP